MLFRSILARFLHGGAAPDRENLIPGQKPAVEFVAEALDLLDPDVEAFQDLKDVGGQGLGLLERGLEVGDRGVHEIGDRARNIPAHGLLLIDLEQLLDLFRHGELFAMDIAQGLDMGEFFGEALDIADHFFPVLAPEAELLGGRGEGLVDLFSGLGIVGQIHDRSGIGHRNLFARDPGEDLQRQAVESDLAVAFLHLPGDLAGKNLLRNRLANDSGQLGRNLSLHPALAVGAEFDEAINGWSSIPQGYWISEFRDQGMTFEGGFTPMDIFAATVELHGSRFTELMERFDHMALFGFMVEDSSRGRVRVANGRPVVDISFPEIEKFDCLPEPRAEGPTAFVSVMEGCSKYCTFCVVPYTRGEEIRDLKSTRLNSSHTDIPRMPSSA